MVSSYLDLILAICTAYISACVVGSSSLFEPLRLRVIKNLPMLRIGNNKHFIECRLCLTFWTSCFAVSIFTQDITHVLPVYGAAYFLATQER